MKHLWPCTQVCHSRIWRNCLELEIPEKKQGYGDMKTGLQHLPVVPSEATTGPQVSWCPSSHIHVRSCELFTVRGLYPEIMSELDNYSMPLSKLDIFS